ncbi:TonB-dependent receptor [Pseudomonas oryzihabitans]|uniref:TonB-dependent receptor n=1 Tax=Pseudomonas oryzihabitans TaxID=47885 RepID=UPI00164275F4|nr:TonB-dependent receptor [Pseudomonas psychrotolerans]
MRHLSASVQATLLSLAVSTQALAQEARSDDSHPEELGPMVVTATRSAKSIADIAGTVYSIERSQVEEQAAAGRSTADILGQLIPSLAPSSGTTSNYGMTMRGRTVQVMVDGVPLTGSRDGARQLNSVTPAMIERIEVISGATSIYGAGATGGLINIITRNADDAKTDFSTRIGLRTPGHVAGDAMAYETAQTAAFQRGPLSGFAGLSYTQQGEIRDARGQRIGPEIAQTDRQDTTSLDVNGRLTWHLNDDQLVSAGVRYYHDEQDSDYGPDYGPNLAVLLNPNVKPSHRAVAGLQLDDQPRTRHYGTNLQYTHRDLPGAQQLTAEAYYRKEESRWFPFASRVSNAALPRGVSNVVMQSSTDIDVWGLRLALQKTLPLLGRELRLTYGLDHERERDRQAGQRYDFNDFFASNGLNYRETSRSSMGPDVTVDKTGLFLQGDYSLTDRLRLQAGVRRETVGNRVEDSIPYGEAVAASTVAGYQPLTLAGGKASHSETLFNLGAVYALTDDQQLFTNFSQGFSLPDVQRMLRDVPASFVIASRNIDSIKVNNYELGWRLANPKGLSTGITAFYNTSDKVVQFNRDFSVSVADTDERIWGLEGNLRFSVTQGWTLGGTLAYTRGQYQDAAGRWRELNAFRVSPLKATTYSEWTFANDYGVRLQALTVGGSDRAYDDAQAATVSPGIRANPATKIQGYTVIDLLAHAPWFGGKVDFGVYNLANRDYKTVYGQQAEATYGRISSLPAAGRTFALSYSVEY